MLADLRLVDCYNMSAMTREARDKAILESAKNNLEQLAFFGLTDYPDFVGDGQKSQSWSARADPIN